MKYIIVLSLIVLAVVPTQSRILQAASNATQASAQANIGLPCIAASEDDRSCDQFLNQSALANSSLPLNATLAESSSEMELNNTNASLPKNSSFEAMHSELIVAHSEMKSEALHSEMKSEALHVEASSEAALQNSSLIANSSLAVAAPAAGTQASAQASLGGICVGLNENDTSCGLAANSSLPVANSSLPIANSSIVAPMSEAKSEMRSEAKSEMKSEARSEMKSEVRSEMKSEASALNIANSTIAGGRLEGEMSSEIIISSSSSEILPASGSLSESQSEFSSEQVQGMWNQAKLQGDKFMQNVSAGAMMICGVLTMAVALMI